MGWRRRIDDVSHCHPELVEGFLLPAFVTPFDHRCDAPFKGVAVVERFMINLKGRTTP